MFTKFFLRNFKVWGEQLWESGVDLAPVTLFLGPNSAGKTSLLQIPLLLKQTFESTDRHLDLNLGGQAGDVLDLGSYEDVIHDHDAERELGLGLEFKGLGPSRKEPSRFRYRTTYGLSAGAPVVHRLCYEHHGDVYGVERQAKGGYLLSAPGYEPHRMGNRLDARRNFQPERSLMLSTEAIAELGEAGSEVQDLGLRLSQAVGQVAYLGPLRERPERGYFWNRQSPGNIGHRGELAVHALLASANTRKHGDAAGEGGKGWLVEKVSTWLARLGIAEGLELEQQGRSRFFEVMIKADGRRANIVDVGFGISQVLPMLVLAYAVPRGATILAEQPELHLHPRAQTGLAELLVEVARERNVQFLVETHSEHIFRRLQFLIADEEVAPHECRLYFVDRNPDRSARLEQLKVDAYGRVENWPKYFFGDSIGETERMTRRMIDRMRPTTAGGSRA
jgi:predicted ATPase